MSALDADVRAAVATGSTAARPRILSPCRASWERRGSRRRSEPRNSTAIPRQSWSRLRCRPPTLQSPRFVLQPLLVSRLRPGGGCGLETTWSHGPPGRGADQGGRRASARATVGLGVYFALRLKPIVDVVPIVASTGHVELVSPPSNPRDSGFVG